MHTMTLLERGYTLILNTLILTHIMPPGGGNQSIAHLINQYSVMYINVRVNSVLPSAQGMSAQQAFSTEFPLMWEWG